MNAICLFLFIATSDFLRAQMHVNFNYFEPYLVFNQQKHLRVIS